MAKEKRDEQATNTSIAIEKRVNSLELRVRKPHMNQNRKIMVLVEKSLEIIERIPHRVRGRRHEGGAFERHKASTDPVLR